jgi:hypothetical protein
VIVYGLYRYYRYLKKRELAATPEPPVSVLEGPVGSVPPGEPAKDPGGAFPAMREAKTALEG